MKKINWLHITIVVWILLRLAVHIFVGNLPLAFIPYGLTGLVLLILFFCAAYAFYEKPVDSRRKFFSSSCILYGVFLIVEGIIYFDNGDLYYWRSFADVLFVAISWYWLIRRKTRQ